MPLFQWIAEVIACISSHRNNRNLVNFQEYLLSGYITLEGAGLILQSYSLTLN